MNNDIKMRIRRNGEEIGTWDRFEIRLFIAQGSLLLSDEVYIEDEDRWISLIPPHRRKWNLFDWSEEDDALWYYIKDGYIFGPRLLTEIAALHDGGFLSEEVLITSVGQDDWTSIGALIADSDTDDLESSAKEHAGVAFRKFVEGDKIGAGLSGFRAIGKLWKDFTKSEPLTSEWICLKQTQEMPSEEAILDAIRKIEENIVETEWVTTGSVRNLCIRFASIEDATRVRDLLQYDDLGGKWTFEFTNRSAQLTK